jgi:hypothetical protein
MIVAIALLIAGFLARRLMMPPAARYLAHHEDNPAAAAPSDEADRGNAPPARANTGNSGNPAGEHLSDSDRRALDEVIRRKTEGH